ncbi:MAG: TlpA disulfide reductase family protein [Steroidobacteraceae bacterium]
MPVITSRRPAFTRRALAAVAVALLAGRLALQSAVAGAVPAIGQPAPALVARQFDGQIIDLGALHGHVVVLNFWASWCTPCRAEMPALNALAREFQARGVTVIGLSVDDPHDRRDALKAAEGLSYSLGMLSEAQRNDFGAPRSLPLTYVIGADGVIRAVLSANRGAVSAEALRASVLLALE